MKEEGRRKKEEGRRKKEEGRRKKEEGRRKKEEGGKGKGIYSHNNIYYLYVFSCVVQHQDVL